jgi:2Fe-2S ferredoxin
MPTITLLPHEALSPRQISFDATPGVRLSDLLLRQGVALPHACEKACVCTTCHLIIRQGFDSLPMAKEEEEDQLGKAWGLEACSRLGCQARMGQQDLLIEIPRYTLNLASEEG